MNIPLVIAAHGTRDAEGEWSCRQLVAMVAERLAPIPVSVGFVELNEPGITQAVVTALAGQTNDPTVAVVPLMVGTGGHVRIDIPDSLEQARAEHPEATVLYAEYLGHDARLMNALHQRIGAAVGEWDRRDTAMVLVGRGAKVVEANADHARLARLIYERGSVAQVIPAFSQVARPSLPEALNQAYDQGFRRLVVAANLLFAGRLRTWLHEQAGAWMAAHPQAEVRVTEVLGPCPELADVVIDRYRQVIDQPAEKDGSPVYLAGLVLRDRPVVVVGAGQVADRRVPMLLAAGAKVHLISPTLSVRLQRLVQAGHVSWSAQPFTEGDLDQAWYALAATNDPKVNAAVAIAAERRRVFCVRADDARGGTAWTPATERVGGLTVGVVGNRNPALSVRVREAVLRELLG